MTIFYCILSILDAASKINDLETKFCETAEYIGLPAGGAPDSDGTLSPKQDVEFDKIDIALLRSDTLYK